MEITNVSYFKVAGHNIKMNVTYFRRPRPGYGQNTRALISYTSLKFLSLGQFLGGWAYNSVQKYYVLSNISQATHLLVQFTSGQIGSRVPCPYTMHGAQYLHAHGKGCSGGWNGGGGGGEGGGGCSLRYTCTLWKNICQEMTGVGVWPWWMLISYFM